MKKLLLGTTAIVGASFVATAAMAKPEVRIGGYMDFQVGMTSQDREGFGQGPGGVVAVPSERGYGFVSQSEVIVRASDKLDSGLTWALKIELYANSDDGNNPNDGSVDATTADEVSLSLSGGWGQVFFGNDDGPVDTMKTGGKRALRDAGTGGVGGNNWRRWANFTTASTRSWRSAADIRDTNDATKIAYITPRFAGFQAGVSFSPDRNDEGRYRDADNNGSEQSFWETAVNYDQKFGDFRVNVAGVATFADNENAQREDTRGWHVGALVSYGGFKVGTGYGRENKGRLSKAATNGDTNGWDVGVGYNLGAWDFGVGYFRSETGNINSTGEHVLQVASLGATYNLGNGLVTYVDGIWFDIDSALNNTNSFDNEGMALITGISVEF